jgi:hypothetical protein
MLRHVMRIVTVGCSDCNSLIPWYSKQGAVGSVTEIVSFLQPTSLAMMGSGELSARNSVGKLAASQMTRYRLHFTSAFLGNRGA